MSDYIDLGSVASREVGHGLEGPMNSGEKAEVSDDMRMATVM